jgi:hypothetical protein
MAAATLGQIKIIHALRRALRLSDADYRDMLYSNYGVTSCTDERLGRADIKSIITKLESRAVAAGVWEKRNHKSDTWATPAQRRKIIGLWADVSRAPADHRDRALDTMVEKVTGVAKMRWLQKKQATNVIVTLTRMKSQKEAGNDSRNRQKSVSEEGAV